MQVCKIRIRQRKKQETLNMTSPTSKPFTFTATAGHGQTAVGEHLPNQEQPSHPGRPPSNDQQFNPVHVFGQPTMNGPPTIRPAVFGRGRAQRFEFTGDQQFQLPAQQASNETNERNDVINTESTIHRQETVIRCKYLVNELETVVWQKKNADNANAHLIRRNGNLDTTIGRLNKDVTQANHDANQEAAKLKEEAKRVEESNREVVKMASQRLTAVHGRIVREMKAQHEKELQQAKSTAAADGLRKANKDAAEVQKLKEEAKRLEEAHRAAIKKLMAKHDRVLREMKLQHERELHAKSESVDVQTSTASPVEAHARPGTPLFSMVLRADTRHRGFSDDSGLAWLEETVKDWQSEERGGRERDTGDIMPLLANLDRKLDGKVSKLENLTESKHLDGRHGHRNDVKAMKGNMDKKIDQKVDHLENCIDNVIQEMRTQHKGVVQAAQHLDVKEGFLKVEGKVGGLEKMIEGSRQEDQNNYQTLANGIGSNDTAIGDVTKMANALLQDGRQQHAEVKQEIGNLGEEGGKMEKLLEVLLEEGRQKSKDLKQTIQGLNGDIDTKVFNLTQTLQRDSGKNQQDMLNAISFLNKEVERLLADLSKSLYQDGGEQHGNLKQTIEEMDQGFQARMANLEELVNSNHHNDEGQQIEELGENFDKKLSGILTTLQQGRQVQHTEVTQLIKDLDSEIDNKIKSLEEWAENMCFKAVKTSIIKVCNV